MILVPADNAPVHTDAVDGPVSQLVSTVATWGAATLAVAEG